VLESFVTKRRDCKAALKFFSQSDEAIRQPKSDCNGSSSFIGAAMKVIGNADRQETGRWLNNRAENSHQLFRRRERAVAKFKSVKPLQKFTAIHASIHNHFNQECHLYSRQDFKKISLPPWQNGGRLQLELYQY